MKATKVVSLMILFALIAAVYSGCKKENDEDPGKQTAWASDNALSESVFDNVKILSDQIMSAGKLKSVQSDTIYMGQCILATLDMDAIPFVLTIDFGETNCQCTDGKYRRGKFIVTFDGDYFSPGTILTFTFDNYFEDDNQILGTKVVTNKGFNDLGHLWWTVAVDGQIIKANNGGTINWDCVREHEWIEGAGSPEWWDDVYLIRGDASGTTAEGLAYTVEVTTDLKFKTNCQWIVSGVLEIQPDGWPLMVVDYGDGTCDNDATVTINGITYPFEM